MGLTVQELIDKLSLCPPDAHVFHVGPNHEETYVWDVKVETATTCEDNVLEKSGSPGDPYAVLD